MRGSGKSVGGQGVVIGDHLGVRCSLPTLPKAMSISRSEILRKNKNTKCPIDAQLIAIAFAEEIQGLQRIALSFL